MVDIKEKLDEGWLHCRIVIEVAGTPKEHVEKTTKEYIEKLKKEKDMIIIRENLAELKKQETGAKVEGAIRELWATFAELEVLFKNPMTLTYFCFDYMPSLIEVLAPEKLTFDTGELSGFFNDLQARLHQVDMLVKQLSSQVPFLNKNLKKLLENFLKLIFSSGKELSSKQLANATGVNQDRIEDYLDSWVDQGLVEMVGEKYRLKSK